jgi:CspA family cold shock protein
MTDENNRLQGEVVFWNGNSFGFIKPDSGDADVFFHVTELPPDQCVQRGDRVTFGVEPDPKKPSRSRAVKVQVRA